MKVLQIIDSLNPGGAERMAINYANLLQKNQIESHICVTRKEGLLKEDIDSSVCYLHLKKKYALDIKAILSLRNYIKINNIDILHAHGSSYFLASVIKSIYPKVKLIWHDHYGNSEFLKDRESVILKYCSKQFDGIISVNSKLKKWGLQNLKCRKIIEVNNFVTTNSKKQLNFEIKGDPSSFKIICIANLRPQKDHETLLKAFERLAKNNNLSLHLIGNDPKTVYSKSLLERINTSPFRENIYYYGCQKDVFNLLEQCDLGVLSSNSEGLPLALLEYGIAKLAVVTTDVGQCYYVVNGYGRLVQSGNCVMLANEILFYHKNKSRREIDANNFNKHVFLNYSEHSVLAQIKKLYSDILSADN